MIRLTVRRARAALGIVVVAVLSSVPGPARAADCSSYMIGAVLPPECARRPDGTAERAAQPRAFQASDEPVLAASINKRLTDPPSGLSGVPARARGKIRIDSVEARIDERHILRYSGERAEVQVFLGCLMRDGFLVSQDGGPILILEKK